MDTHYFQLKKDIGMIKKEEKDVDEYDLDAVFKALRPNTTAANFKDFLKNDVKNDRSVQWKAVKRKID